MSVIRPYGDTTGDGMVQVSFTLPVPHGKLAEGAAAELARAMGIDPALVVHATPVGPQHTFFVVYGPVRHLVTLSEVVVLERDYPLLTPKEVNAAITTRLRRKLVVVGACIGTDAHTVGIDAILNIKGFAGDKGLAYYREIRVVNLGAQVSVPDLLARARTERADAVLISQVVTQRDAHLTNTRQMATAFRAAHYAGHPVDGAYSLACFGDVATEICIRADADEGLLASYTDVQFTNPVRAGDVLEITGRVIAIGWSFPDETG
jgi:beta-lysine 5,6-aminomutase beta subunit